MHRDTPILLLGALLLPGVAFAYIDPGFGALVWQAAVAALLGAVFFLRSTIAATFRMFRRKISGGPAPEQAASPSERPTEPG